MAAMISISAMTGATIAAVAGVAPTFGLPMGASAASLEQPSFGRAMRTASRPGRRPLVPNPFFNDRCGVIPSCISGDDAATVLAQYDSEALPAVIAPDVTGRLASVEESVGAMLGI